MASKKPGTAKKSGAAKSAGARKKAQEKAKNAPKSKHFGQAMSRAKAVLGDPLATVNLATAAEEKAAEDEKVGKISQLREQLAALLRLIRAYANGDYRAISWESLVLIVAALIYFVSPIDAIPDFLPVGYIDDAAVIAFVLAAVNEEVNDFTEWEKRERVGTG